MTTEDTSRPRHILVSGGGIAGPALAHWLDRYGWRVTVVERSDGPRDAGQNIDVRGVGHEVLRRMGIEDAVRAEHTGEEGTRFVDDDGRTVAEFPAGEGGQGPTAELEILRGRLSRILVDRGGGTEYVYGDRITALDDDGDRVRVTFRNGPERTFDLVVIADGLRSPTRDLVFPTGAVHELGVYMAFLTLPRTPTDSAWWRWHVADRNRSVSIRPDNVGTSRGLLGVLSDVRGLEDLPRAEQVRILRRTFAGIGWEAPRVLDALDDAPMYLEALGQTRLPYWTHGRVALLGDAAFCASPISGMSTTLALTGAYVLAGELATAPDHLRAFARYESVMRPFVDRAQRLSPGAPRLGSPRTRAGRSVMFGVIRTVARPSVGKLLGLAGSLSGPPVAETIDLPDYPVPAETSTTNR